MWQERVEVQAPYDFSRVLEHLARDPLSNIHLNKQEIIVPLYIHEIPVAVSVQSIGTKERPHFLVTAKYQELKEEILERISYLFQWKTPLAAIHNHFLNTELKEIFIQHEGTPLILDFDLYFCLMKCLIHQQLNMKFAYRLTERFVKTFGKEIDGVWFYPRPEDIAALSYEDLRSLQFSGRKAEYIIDTSKLIAEGKLNLEKLREASDEEVMKALLPIRGIGPWTVQNFLLFGLGRPNLFPKADIGIQNAIKQLLHLEQKPSYEQMEELSKKWEPYLSYASLYLWRSIE
ncbi:DNA-3-methyladenine glycosylase II [Anoxybacillus vitaminiphilus]|uniref:DNA-3-methyladenine glycosylase II n=1 Tax=Paranoxybacillus vitaminiphilus TaxID=581036 RepID=A0A327YDW4_9BACL|nr:DNA-3-methyladenine glycosylase [Anoxybacillus vitaminiphilus]RAK19200.1 DNA-3-methyladenine glycosylase II [Anoxybacillus vitaminiphilus]